MHSKIVASNITIHIDNQDRLVSFEFSKVPCGIKVSPDIHYDQYCIGKTLEEIINIPFEQAASDLLTFLPLNEQRKSKYSGLFSRIERSIFWSSIVRLLWKRPIKPASQEDNFFLYVEWEALRTSIAQYLGIERQDIDRDRCMMSSVEHTNDGHTISLMLLPPKELSKI